MPHLQGGKIMMALSRLLPWFLRVSPAGDTSMTFLPRGRLGVALRAGWSGRLLLLLLALSTLMAQPVAAAATPKVYVGLFKDNAVAVLDTSTNRVQSIIPVPQGPHGLAITPDGRKVYVSSDGASTVSVIDTQTDKVVGSIEVGANPHGLAMSADGRQVLVGGFGTNQVLLIDTTTDQVVARLPVPMPHNSALSPDGHMAYVGSQQQGATAVVILDLTQHTQVGTVPLEKTPRALTLSSDAKQLYVTVAGIDAVQVVDLASRRVAGQISTGASPHHVLTLPNGSAALVVSQGPGTLELFDPTRHIVSQTIRVGTNPHWIALSTDGRTAYVTNEGSQDVAVVDVASRTVTATVPVGNAPRKIVVQPGPVGQGTTPAPTAQAPTPRTVTISDHGTLEVKGQTEVELEADEYYFKPTFLQGAPGQKLKLEIENESGTLHNISIPEQQLDVDIPPKGKVTVAVVFPASGTVRFFCKFHEALGMHGALRVGDTTRPAGSPGPGAAPSTGAQH
jgi:YVTN family beta-propeller protein